MLQVDENIGGRQDQKSYGLRTKTLAVGLLMVLGCFAVGYFSATTTTTATTRVSQQLTTNSIPNDDAPQCTKDDFCQRDYGICSNPGYYPAYNCCSGKYTLDVSCLDDENSGCAVRCGTGWK